MDNNIPEIEIGQASEEFNKCDLCTNSKCCTYVTQQIDTPKSKYDFEILLWQVSHDGVGAYKDDDGWFVMFEGRCRHLLGEHANDYCEYDAPAEDGFDLYFPDYDTLLRYCKKRFKRWSTGNPPPG
jgi:hypothetical protein